jgi:hypothetical protein
MKKLLLVSVLLVLFLQLSAQAPDWLWARGSVGVNYNYGNSIATDHHGNVYVAGAFFGDSINISGTNLITNNGNTDLSIFIVKYDNLGNLIWAKDFSGNGYDNASLTIDNEDNIYLAGYFQSDSITFGNTTLYNAGMDSFPTNSDIFIARMDTSGNIIWALRAGTSGYDQAAAITTDNQGNIYVTGGFEDTLAFNEITLINNDVINPTVSSTVLNDFVIKLDKTGTVIWGRNKLADGCSTIAVDNNRNVYVTGQFSSANTFDVNKYVEKYDSFGNSIWIHNLDGSCIAWAQDADSVGNVYVAGEFNHDMHLGNITLTPDSGFRNSYFIKYDTNGNLIWAKTLGENANISVHALVSNNHDGIYLTGIFGTDSVNFNGISIFNTDTNTLYNWDIFALKCDTAGNAIWAKAAGGKTGGDGAIAIALNEIGNVYVTGRHASDSCHFDNIILTPAFNYFLAKIDVIQTQSLDEKNIRNNSFLVLPNPNNGKFIIQCEANGSYQLKVYNLMGEELHHKQINASQAELDLSTLSNGVYVLTLNDGINSLTKRLVVAK